MFINFLNRLKQQDKYYESYSKLQVHQVSLPHAPKCQITCISSTCKLSSSFKQLLLQETGSQMMVPKKNLTQSLNHSFETKYTTLNKSIFWNIHWVDSECHSMLKTRIYESKPQESQGVYFTLYLVAKHTTIWHFTTDSYKLCTYFLHISCARTVKIMC